MSLLYTSLEALRLHEYYNRLVEHGFDTWQSLAGIHEAEMASLGIKLGHRRKLQRELASMQGYPAREPLFPATHQTMQQCSQPEDAKTNATRSKCCRMCPPDPHPCRQSTTVFPSTTEVSTPIKSPNSGLIAYTKLNKILQ